MWKGLRVALAALGIAVSAAATGAQPLTIVVGYPPGGASDRIARLVADRLGQRLHTTVIVENRTGAGGRIAAQWVRGIGARQNVLLLGNPAMMVVAPLVYAKPGYDVDKDFKPVAMVSRYVFGLAVGAGSPIHDMAGLRDELRRHPGKFVVGVPATGSLPNFFALMLGKQLGEKPEVVGYRGSAPLVTELIGGILPQAIDTFDTLLPQQLGGKIRILAISAARRDPRLPNVPTFREAGLDLEADGWGAFFAPAAMPDQEVRHLGREIAAIMREPTMRQAVLNVNLEPVSADAAATAARFKAYRAQWEPVVRASGFVATP